MLQLTFPRREWFDDSKQELVYLKGCTLQLEHSLISISKWEAKWKKPFISSDAQTLEESKDYIRCMTLNTNVPSDVYDRLTGEDYAAVRAYIDDKMTATWFSNKNKKKSGGRGQVVTSELIYYWMIQFNIPFECQKWHLNRLLTLIEVCEAKSAPSKKMSRKDIYARNRELNAARRKKLGTKG